MMKKSLLLLALLTVGLCASAQELTDAQKAAAEAAVAIDEAPQGGATLVAKPKYWTNALSTTINFGQTAYANWSAGGYNNYTLKGYVDGTADYVKDNISWKNRLQLDYGFLYSDDKPVLQKSDDRIYLESKFGYNVAKNLDLSAELSFKSQFSNTYDYDTPTAKADGSELGEGQDYTRNDWKAARSLKSGFFSPAYLNLALGIDWTPLNWLTVNVAPITGGIVFVDDPLLRESYSMDLKDEDSVEIEDDPVADGKRYEAARFEFGTQLKIDAKVNVNDNFKYTSQLVLFSNYLDNPQNIRVNWDNRIEWKLAKYFSLVVATNLIYDDKVWIEKTHDDGSVTYCKKVQFKEALTFGFAYSIASKR